MALVDEDEDRLPRLPDEAEQRRRALRSAHTVARTAAFGGGMGADRHPLVPDSYIEDTQGGLTVGCIRNLKQTDGGKFRERLLALSDTEHSQTYSLLDPPLTVTSMVTTLRLLPITDGDRTYLKWSSEFEVGKEDEAKFGKHPNDFR